MTARRLLPLLGLALSLSTFNARAQSFTLSLDRQNAPVATGTGQDLSTTTANVITESNGSITVTCASAQNACAGLDLKLTLLRQDDTVVRDIDGTASSNALLFSVPASEVTQGVRLGYKLDGALQAPRFPLQASAGGSAVRPPQPGPAQTTNGVSTNALLTRLCRSYPEAQPYDRQGNRANIVVTPTGVVVSSDVAGFDENDALVVTVVADPRILPSVKVRRSSAFGPRGVVRLVGDEVRDSVDFQRESMEDAPPCVSRDFVVRDFQPGRGEVELSLLGTPDRSLAKLDLNVNPLYSGALTLGPARTSAVDPEFRLVSRPVETDGEGEEGDSEGDPQGTAEREDVIIRGNEGDRDFLYTLFYTPYVWGRRDLEKGYPWYTYINPTLGVSLEDPLDNVFFGGSVSLPVGITVAAGWHARRIDILSPEFDIAEGDPFDASTDPDGDPILPVATEVSIDRFIAASIDLRAAVKVFGSLFRLTPAQ